VASFKEVWVLPSRHSVIDMALHNSVVSPASENAEHPELLQRGLLGEVIGMSVRRWVSDRLDAHLA